MTPEEQRQLVDQHYDLNFAGNHPAARELLTEDFEITVPPYMPFAGSYRGRDAFQRLNPIVVETVAVTGIARVATTIGIDCAVEIVEFTLADHDGPPVQVAELIRFRDKKICEIRPFYFDPGPMIAAAQRRHPVQDPKG